MLAGSGLVATTSRFSRLLFVARFARYRQRQRIGSLLLPQPFLLQQPLAAGQHYSSQCSSPNSPFSSSSLRLRSVPSSSSSCSADATMSTTVATNTATIETENEARAEHGRSLDLERVAPDAVNGMTELDRSRFTKQIPLRAVRVPASRTNEAMKAMAGDLIDISRIRCVVNDPHDSGQRLVLLSHRLLNDLSEASASTRDFIEKNGFELVPHVLTLDYDYWPADVILRCVIPHDLEIATSFEIVGHIAHVNLRDHLLPYKSLIGQVILDKNKAHIKTVVNKVDVIESKFRVFPMEILAGENNFVTKVYENGCSFEFDFSKVYWNSRLHTEHSRILGLFAKNSFICDVFAGVGPFAIPASKKGCVVYANDLNPDSHKFLVHNSTKNKTKTLEAFNMDGRDFIAQSMSLLHKKHPGKTFDHYIMNLPATSIEFLDAFRGIYAGLSTDSALPMIHVHCFSKSEDPEKDVVERAEAVLGYAIKHKLSVHNVRKVAPNKEMMCISFQLPYEAAFSCENAHEAAVQKRKEVEVEDLDSSKEDGASKRSRSEKSELTDPNGAAS